MADYKKLSDGERLNLVQNAILNKVNMLLDMVPGYRGYRRGVENVIGMAQGQPNRYSVDEYIKDLGYSMVPFYGAYDDAVNGRPQDWKSNLIEAALIGLPLNGPRGVKRTDPKRVPIDEARTAEFNQKLDELIRNPELTPSEKVYINALRDSRLLGNNPAGTALNRNENILGQVLDKYGLGDYYDDIVFGLHGRGNVDDFINPEEYRVYRKYFADRDPMDVPYNYAADEYRGNYLDVNRDNILNYNTGLDIYKEIANRRNIDKPFGDFIVDYYDKANFNYEPAYINALDYEFTPRRLKEKFDNGNINQQEILNEYIDRTLKPTEEWHKEVLDILKSDLPKEEKKALIQGRYGEHVIPIEIEELLL